MSFDGYADPLEPSAGQSSAGQPIPGDPNAISIRPVSSDEPQVSYGEDIAKGAAGGLGRGTAGTLGIGGTVGNLVRAGLGKAGVPEDYLDKGAAIMRTAGKFVPQLGLFTGPDPAQIQKTMEGYTGPFYQPKTIPGQYASTLAEFAPGMVIPGGGGIGARVFNTVVPAIASETAGQLTSGTPIEPYARFAAGMVAGPAAGKLVTPTSPPSATRVSDIAKLDAAGIPLTAGQRTGSKPIQWMEASAADMPFSGGRAADMNTAQADAYNRAITGGMFDPRALQARGIPRDTNLPDPGVFATGKQSLKDEYTRLTQGNELVADPRLNSDLFTHRTQYEKNVLPSQRNSDVEHIHNDLIDQLVQGGGRMPGDVYQANRSWLGDLGDSATNPAAQNAFKGMQKALDDAMTRNLSPADAAAWKLNNQRYAVMKQLSPAIAKAGENLSPQAVASALRVGRPEQFAAQSGVLDPLAQAATNVIKPMPQSGTAARMGMQKLFDIPKWLAVSGAGGAGAGAGFLLGGPLGAMAGAAAPFIASRLALSRPGQAYLANQLMPNNVRGSIAQALMQQAISQPSGVAQNRAAQSVNEQQRKQDLRNAGLGE
jgi:hypothetical protein